MWMGDHLHLKKVGSATALAGKLIWEGRMRVRPSMRYWRALSLALGMVALAGCDTTSTSDEELARAALVGLREEQRSYPPPTYVPEGEERALIEQVLSRFEGAQREVLRLILLDSVAGGLYFLGDPETDSLVRRIYELRAERLALPPNPGRGDRVPVMLALVDSSRADEDLSIVRRSMTFPIDVIVLRDDRATGERLAAAVVALQRLWRASGNTPPDPVRLRVRAMREVGRSFPGEVQRASKWIASARQRDPIVLPVVGKARVVVIPIRP